MTTLHRPVPVATALATRARPSWSEAWTTALLLVVATRAAFVAVALAGASLLDASGTAGVGSLERFEHYDALRYRAIAEHGYGGTEDTAFFPLLPLALRTAAALGVGSAAAGTGLALVASVVACAYLWRTAEEEVGRGTGQLALLLLLLAPTAVFLVAPYTEPLFLAGAVPALYHARRGSWPAAGAFGAVAVASRASGLFLLAALATELVVQRPPTRAARLRASGGLLLAALPLVAFTAYAWHLTGDPLAYLHAQAAGWGRHLGSPWSSFTDTVSVVRDGVLGGSPVSAGPRLVWLGELVAAAVGVAGTVLLLLRREWSYAVLTGSTMAVLLCTGPRYLSLPRMLLSLFPLVLVATRLVAGRPRLRAAAPAVLAPVATLGVLVYTGGSAWFY